MQNTPLQTAARQFALKFIPLLLFRRKKSHCLPGRRSKFAPQIIMVKPRLESEQAGMLGGSVVGGGTLCTQITSKEPSLQLAGSLARPGALRARLGTAANSPGCASTRALRRAPCLEQAG